MINIKYLFNPYKCGHFCLKYIFRKYHIKNKEKYEKNFMSIASIKKVLIKNNIKSNAYQIKGLENLNNNKEYITLLKYKKTLHYIVLLKFNQKNVYFYDPLFLFTRKMKIKRFLKKWHKYILTITL